MKIFGKREKVPADVLSLVTGDDRVVSWADAPAGPVVATTRGLWWPTHEGHRLIGWQSITKATWQDELLTVTEADVVDDLLLVDRTPVRTMLTFARDLPPVVRRRVEQNIAHTEQVAVGGGVARLVGRRIPGQDGLRWWARLEGAVDTDEVRSAIRARLARLDAELVARTRG